MNLTDGSTGDATAPSVPKLPDVADAVLGRPGAGRSSLSFQPVQPQPAEADTAKTATPRSSPVNDDRRTAGQILKTMEVRASRWPYGLALAASLAWAGLCGFYATSHNDLLVPFDAARSGFLVAALVGPVLVAFVVAALMVRVRELRLTTRSMTQVALRLAEPESLASEQVISLSQAIRREVASMGDGIERALARASELETLVHSEISNLERSFGDNERRVRALVEAMVSEREALVASAEQMRGAISTAHDSLTGDLADVSTRIVESVDAAGSRVARALGAKGEEIAITLGSAGELLVRQLSDHSDNIVANLSRTGADVSTHLANASSQVSQALATEIDEIDARLNSTGKALIVDLGMRGNEVIDRLDHTGEQIANNISSSGDNLVARVAEIGDRMHETVNVRGSALGAELAEAGTRISADIARHSEAARQNLDQSQQALGAMLDQHTRLLDSNLQNFHSQMQNQLVASGTEMAASLDGHTAAAGRIFDSASQVLDQALDAHSEYVTRKLDDHAARVTGALVESSTQTIQAMQEQSDALQTHFGSFANGAIDDINRSFNAFNGQFSEEAGAHRAEIAARNQELQEHLARYHEQFTTTATTTTQALRELTDQHAANFADHAATISGHLNDISAQSLTGFAVQADMFNQNFARQAEAHLGELAAGSAALEEGLAAHRQQLATLAEQHGASLNEQFARALDAQKGETDAFEARFATNVDAHLAGLAASNAAIEEGFVAHHQHLTALAEQHASTLHDHFARALESQNAQAEAFSDSFASQSAEHRHEIANNHAALQSGIAALHDEFNRNAADRVTALDDLIRDHDQRFTAQAEALTLGVAASHDAFHRDFADAAETARANLLAGLTTSHDDALATAQDATSRISTALRGVTDEFAATAADAVAAIGMHGDRVNDTIATRLSVFEDTISHSDTGVAQRIDAQVDRLTATIDARLGDLESIIGTKAEELDSHLLQRTEASAQSMQARLSALTSDSDARGEALRAAFDQIATRIDTGLQARTSELNDALRQRAIDVARNLSDGSGEIARVLDDKLVAIGDQLNDRMQAVSALLDDRTNEINIGMANRAEALGAALSGHVDRLESNVVTPLVQVNQNLATQTGALTDMLSTRTAEISALLSEHSVRLNAEVENQRTQLANVLDSTGTSTIAALDSATRAMSEHRSLIDQTFSAHADDFHQRLSHALAGTEASHAAALDQAAQMFSNHRALIDQSFAARGADLDNVLEQRTQTLARTLAAGTEVNQRVLDEANQALDSTLSQRAQELGATLVARLNDIDSTLITRLGSVHASLGDSGRALGELLEGRLGELQDLFDVKGKLVIDTLSARGYDINRNLAEVSEMVGHAIDNRGATIIQHLNRKQVEMTAAIDQSTHALGEVIDGGTNSSITSLATLGDRLSGELGGVLARLDAAHQALSTLVNNANYNLSSLEGALSGRMKDFAQAMGGVSEQVNALNETATTTLNDGHALASRLDGHARALATSAAALLQVQSSSDATLSQRRASLEALLTDINARAADFDSMTQSFAQRIDASFAQAEDRAREIGDYLVQSAEAGQANLHQQFSELRKLSSGEQERQADALREAGDKARREVGEVLNNVVTRFNETVAQLRDMSGQIARELEETRSELAGGIKLIPQEASAQANAMRQVVSDHIKALNELSDMVVKSGRGMNVIAPATMAPQVAAPAPAVVAPPQIAPAPAPAPHPVATKRPVDFAGLEAVRQAMEATDLATRPAPAATGAASLPPLRGTRASEPWADILARAARDDAEAPGQSLEALSVNIARLVNQQAMYQAIAAHSRGERNALSLAIYTAEGRERFNDIARRYGNDPAFATAVRQYVADFETRLAHANRSDATGQNAQTLLASDAAKIYFMLAHASGRFN
ncbi:MAG: hypothetical protein KGQ37_00690 [Hyphomicrobiales bacterium]|nr:hypothetical protein [Hyphomicrobiales bacterium]